ncbi:enterochelin esterase-like enzyme [Prosthecobacter fusiformis]|uniref:Enterochelin esterase-like enzyme n=1 Tax=Prosthecobacter fusiformis TaxID=48464 RepID=A0A4R7S6W8_9BACT|nr:alpha/beta hydrolase-fold protein [Prosthecobacter fusiformis]TDU73318.1 enterochelin esterase-like enzyme [Prosthecobacter fusiformis]
MKIALLFLCLTSLLIQAAEPEFPLTPDSNPQPGIAQGTLLKDIYTAQENSVFPGTAREYQIYLPAGFDKSQPVHFMVFQDGVIYKAPVVFDNLIAKKDIPPLVGIFIKPGVVPAANDNALPRFNRSYEYDSITDTYSKFLINEFLPEIEKKHDLKLSHDANHAAISGNSSGGICAFMVAWHRPDRFRRVFTGVGTYVGIHGADQLPVIVRKFEPKPLRIFLQSGTGDNNLYCGDWWMANQMMERSLTWAGYDVDHAWGEGGHNQKHASQIFPDVMRWLWRDWQTDINVKANPKHESKWKGYEVVTENLWEKHSDVDASSPTGAVLLAKMDGSITLSDEHNARTLLHGNLQKPLPPSAQQFEFASTTLSPDQTVLYVKAKQDSFVYSFPISTSREIRSGQKFYQLETFGLPALENPSGLCVDTDGRLYVATSLGIQVCDQAGRVNFIIPTPQPAHDVCFGGKDLSELFIACGDAIYKRPTIVHGIISSQQPPLKPAAPKL